MDIPDKIIDGADVRLWRFRADNLDVTEFDIADGCALPIYGLGLEWIGAATLEYLNSGPRLYGVCGADVPERLDFDNGVDIYLQPVLAHDLEMGPEVRGFRFSTSPGPYGVLIEADVL